MSEGISPKRSAIQLVQLWRAVHGPALPLDAAALAQEWSRNVSPEAPIGVVQAEPLPGFEGGLFWLKKRSEWALLYHPSPDNPGRSNFTIAHEFGHYVLHRRLREEFQCSSSSAFGLTDITIEREADQFASYLLMPIDDFKAQIEGRRITLDLLSECATRYGVSLTAAMLKWLEFTDQAAIAVMGREGMLHWWRASDRGKSYALRHLRSGMELPLASLAVLPETTLSTAERREGTSHAVGIWPFACTVTEMAIISQRFDLSVSLLVLDAPGVAFDYETTDSEPAPWA